eukprot:sb/3476702/
MSEPCHQMSQYRSWRSDIWPRSSSCRSVCAAWKQRPGVGEDRRSVRCDRSFSTVTTIARWSRHKYVALGFALKSRFLFKVRFKRLDLRFLEIGVLRVIFTKRDPEFPGISGQVV